MSEVIPDMAGLLGCYVAIALLFILTGALEYLEGALNFSLAIPHIKTFHVSAGTWLFGSLIKTLTNATHTLEHWAVRFEQDIATMFEVLVALPILAAEGSHKGLQALWQIGLKTAISPALTGIRSSIATVSSTLDTTSSAIYDTSTALPTKIGNAISAAANGAYAHARSYTDALRSDVVADFNAAKSYTDSAVAVLRSAEDAAISAASQLASSALSTAARDLTTAEQDARNLVNGAVTSLTALVASSVQAGENVAASALSGAVSGLQNSIAAVDQAVQSGIQAARSDLANALDAATTTIGTHLDALEASVESDIGQARYDALYQLGVATAALTKLIQQAEQLAAAEVGQAADVGAAALGQVKAIAVGANDELEHILGKLSPDALATLLASIPALATLVAAIATEAGLGNASCREKVKGICGTDPAAWARLLSLATFLTLAFDFKEFVQASETVASAIGEGVVALERPFIADLPPLALAA